MTNAMEGHHVLIGLLVAVSLVGSILLIPRGQELGLIYLRAGDYGRAERIYEAEVAKGDLSPTAIEPLSRLYVQEGKINAAIALLERFVARNPSNVTARRLLGTYYQWAQRPEDYRKNLVVLTALDPTEETLRQLAAIDSFDGDIDGEIAALQRIIGLYSGMPDDYLDVAELMSARGRLLDAADELALLQRRSPQAITDYVIDLWINLLIEAKQPEQALTVAQGYLADHSAAAALRHIAEIFAARELPAQGLVLLEKFPERVAGDPALTLEKFQFAIDSGRGSKVAGELAALWSRKEIPPVFYGQYVPIATAVGDSDLALALADRINLSSQSAEVVANVIDFAIEQAKPALLHKLQAEAGETFLAAHPVLAGRLALALGSRQEAERWADLALRRRDLAPQRSLELAMLYSKLGRGEQARALMAKLASGNALPDADYPQMAEIYVALKRAAEGAALFDRLLADRHQPGIFEGWALTSAAAGRGKAVAMALTPDATKDFGDQFLLDLYYQAVDLKIADLALRAARLLVARRDRSDDRLRLAHALLLSGRADEAWPMLRALRGSGLPDAQPLYVEALTEAAKQNDAAREELETYWTAALDNPALPEKERNEALYGLIDLKAWAEVLPTLAERARQDPAQWLDAYVTAAFAIGRQVQAFATLSQISEDIALRRKQRETALYLLLDKGGPAAAVAPLRRAAEDFGGDWIDAYGNALRKLGRQAEFVAFLRARAREKGLPAAERRNIAAKLLVVGDKNSASAIYQSLAAAESPSSDDVEQLLFLWGPRPTPPQLDWLEARAHGSQDAARAGWLQRLLAAGAADRVVEVVVADNAAAANGDVAAAYIEALATLHRTDALDSAIATQLDRETDPDRLAAYAQDAIDADRLATARRIFQKLLSIAPNNRHALREAGLFAFVDEDFRRCIELLGRYLAGGQGDWEVHYYYGESLLQEKRAEAAHQQFQLALSQIDREAKPTLPMRQTKAYLLYHLGETQASLDLYKTLLREQPGNKDLRADFASVLIQLGDIDRAARLIAMSQTAGRP
ncbi:MAG: tetratricopeptide repeat protein [Stellaceae bacterium]